MFYCFDENFLFNWYSIDSSIFLLLFQLVHILVQLSYVNKSYWLHLIVKSITIFFNIEPNSNKKNSSSERDRGNTSLCFR